MRSTIYSACEPDSLLPDDTGSPAETKQDAESADQIRQAYNKVIAYLARREYSKKELEQRLLQKQFSYACIKPALARAIEHGYQSDERFTEMYIRSRVNAGDGPFKIKISLREKGICESLALAVLDAQGIDWREQAKSVKEKRFGLECDSQQQLAKQIRYLKNKGFYQDDIQAVVSLN